MTKISELPEQSLSEFFLNFEVVKPMASACMMSNFGKLPNLSSKKSQPPGSDIKYLKFHFFILVSALVDTIAVLGSHELNVEKDDELREVLENVKANALIKSFNEIPLFNELPMFKAMHGQDILLFRAIEKESLTDGISFFDFRRLRVEFGEYFLKLFLENDNEQAKEQNRSAVYQKFGDLLTNNTRLAEVDLNFVQIMTETATQPQKVFVNELSAFMRNLPENVYHCHDGKTKYSGRGLKIDCHCGAKHDVDSCEAICDGGYAHYAVFRAACNSAIVKVETEGLFRIKGLKTVSQVFASSSNLLDLASEVISSRKRSD